MDRISFIKSLGALGTLSLTNMTLIDLKKLSDHLPASDLMPVLFVGHGNPMNAIEDNEFSRGWQRASEGLKPAVILCVSAHWETHGSYVTGMDHPETIHDFGGFPQALFDTQYPAPGSPAMAKVIQDIVTTAHVGITQEWGLDHGTWSVLIKMFPNADVPVLQLSLDRSLSADKMYALAQELGVLRTKGVLIVGSGNIVHNLRLGKFGGSDPAPYDWAIEFDEQVAGLINERNHASLVDYRNLGKAANLSIPTPEHYLPMLYTLGLQRRDEHAHFFNESIAFGSGSMRSFIIA